MHIQEKELNEFQNGTMNTEEMIAFLEHLDKCDFCLEQMVHMEEQQKDILAPDYLKNQILTQAASPKIKAEKTVSYTSHKMHMLYYGLHTAAGVIAALVILFCIGRIDFSEIQTSLVPLTEYEAAIPESFERNNYLTTLSNNLGTEISSKSNKLADYLNDFTNKIVNGGK